MSIFNRFGGNSEDYYLRKYILGDDSPCIDDGISTDDSMFDKRCTSSDVGPLPDFSPTGERYVWCDCYPS